MPSFEAMKQHNSSMGKSNSSIIGEQIRANSNDVRNIIFDNNTTYRVGKIYDRDMKPLEEIEFKFLKHTTHTISQDAVEFFAEFRPGFCPEIVYDYTTDKKHRLGFYLDVYDDSTNEVDKWLIIGKDTDEVNRYNMLKCNWNFEWLDTKRNYHKVLGVVRDRNNYNSGIWTDNGVTTIQNETSFILPNNIETCEVNYGMRFMITDNTIYPKVYQATKLMDTFPLGTLKVACTQVHYNEHTDLCKVIDIDDGNGEIMHMICDWYKSGIPPIIGYDEENSTWKLTSVNSQLYVNREAQIIEAISDSPNPSSSVIWNYYVDGTKYSKSDLVDYFDIDDSSQNKISIRVINSVMINYIVKVSITDSLTGEEYDFVEMEVTT